MSPTTQAPTWRSRLSRWTESLRGKLHLPIQDAAPLRAELQEELWIHIHVPPENTNAETTLWREALQLLDVLAALDGVACWELIVDLCDARSQLESRGCPIAFLTALRPRYELRFNGRTALADDSIALLLKDDDTSQDPWSDFSETKKAMIASYDGQEIGVPTPIPIRFFVDFHAPERTRYEQEGQNYLNPGACFQRVRVCAAPLAGVQESSSVKFSLASVGFNLQETKMTDDARTLLRQVGCAVPLHLLQWGFMTGSIDGPFLWQLLVPHASPTRGLRELLIEEDVLYSWMERHAIIALCSAVHRSRSLQKFAFHETDKFRRFGGKGPQWCEWLAFALFSKTAQHQIHTLTLTFGKDVRSYVDAIKRTVKVENADTVSTDPHTIQWPPTVVRVNAATSIHGFDLHEQRNAKSVYEGNQTVECLVASEDYGHSARILIPGVGVGCVARKDVLSQDAAPTRETHPIENLTLTLKTRCSPADGFRGGARDVPFDPVSALELLQLIGRPLLKLTLICDGDRPTQSLPIDRVLLACPQLQSLQLVNLTFAAEPLFVAKHTQSLQSITLEQCNVLDNARLRAHYIPPRAFPRLTSLFLDATGHDVHNYVLTLAAQRNLHRLVVRCDDKTLRKRYAAHMQRWEDKPVPMLPLREKLAFLSFIAAGPSSLSTVKHRLSMDTVALIFEMASTAMRRRVCTLLE